MFNLGEVRLHGRDAAAVGERLQESADDAHRRSSDYSP